MPLNPEIQLGKKVHWTYQTDDMHGICIIAKDKMTINFKFEAFSKEIYDVLKIDMLIRKILENPVSVEGAQENLKSVFPGMEITVRGRADSHGWITARS